MLHNGRLLVPYSRYLGLHLNKVQLTVKGRFFAQLRKITLHKVYDLIYAMHIYVYYHNKFLFN